MEITATLNVPINFKKWGLTDRRQSGCFKLSVLSLPGARPPPPLPASSPSRSGTLPLPFCLLSSQGPPSASGTCFLSQCSPEVSLLLPLLLSKSSFSYNLKKRSSSFGGIYSLSWWEVDSLTGSVPQQPHHATWVCWDDTFVHLIATRQKKK